MRRVLAGGFLSLNGSLWALAIFLLAANHPMDTWRTPPGKLLASIMDLNLMPLFAVSVVFVAVGVLLMIVECFKKEHHRY